MQKSSFINLISSSESSDSESSEAPIRSKLKPLLIGRTLTTNVKLPVSADTGRLLSSILQLEHPQQLILNN